MRTRAAALALAALVCFACAKTRRVGKGAEGEQPAGEAKPEAPDSAAEKGVPPAEGRPRVPAAPEALLAEGAVARIQDALARRGLLAQHRRGELDQPTSKAIARFQESEELAATGFPDRETLARLGVDPDEAYGRAGDAPRE